MADLSTLGFESFDVEIAGYENERSIAKGIGVALGFPETFRGGWDAFLDLLRDHIILPGRAVAIHVVDADELAHRDMRVFVRLIWMLMSASESVEAGAAGEAQLEFLFWGDWQPSRG